jgi:outer membrane lipoprotein-sorting protein
MHARVSRLFLLALFPVLLAALALTPFAGRAQAGGDVNAILRQMDVGAKNFKSAQAEFEWDQSQLVVQATDVQKGSIAFRRQGTDTEMSARIREFNGQPEPKELLYRSGTLQFYQPKIKQVTIFSAGANRSQYESFLTLGFGGSGTDLDKNWAITYQGDEVIDGVKTAKLDLIPRQANIKQTFSHVTIWVDPARAISLKQQFFEPSGDYRLAVYRNIRYNTPIGNDVFNIKTEPGTQVVHK